MKLLGSVLLITTLAMGQASTPATAPSTPASSQSIPVDQENARKAKAVLDQMIQALGGQAYLNIQDISQEGRSYSFHLGRPVGTGLLYWRFYKFPDKDRVEVTKKRDVVYVNNGDRGFEITYKGPHPQDPKDVSEFNRRRGYSLDWVVRKWLVEPGVALFYEGQAVAEQKPVDQVTIMNARNQGVTLFIDATTHLPVKKTFTWRDPADKLRNVEDEIYDAYRPVQGIMTPFSLTRSYNGDMSSQRFLNTVSYNQGLNDSLFEVSVPSGSTKPPHK